MAATIMMPPKPPTSGGLRGWGIRLDTAKLWAEANIKESQETEECDVILVTRSQIIGGEPEMKRDAHDALKQALNQEELEVEYVRDHVFVGNRHGLNLAALSTRVFALEEEIASQKNQITLHKNKIASLEDRVCSLTSSVEAYKTLRSRFISTFKRDKLRNADELDLKLIAAGNAWAHGGDAVVDAQLYQGTCRRKDYSAFKELYGIHPLIVLEITHNETINVLNTHAAVIASKFKAGSDEFYKRFTRFIELFEKSDYDSGFLDGHPTNVTYAYWDFMNCTKDEVTEVEVTEVEVTEVEVTEVSG